MKVKPTRMEVVRSKGLTIRVATPTPPPVAHIRANRTPMMVLLTFFSMFIFTSRPLYTWCTVLLATRIKDLCFSSTCGRQESENR